MKVALDEFEALTKQVIAGFGYDAPEVEIICDVLMHAQLRGNNQGVVKLIGPGIPKDPTATPIEISHETDVSATVDGGRNHAMVVVNHAVDVALVKAGDMGVGIVGVNSLGTSSGAIGYYARRIADHGMIGIVLASAPPSVAPHGSYEPVFGTNPLAIAVPSRDDPVVLDMATAAMALYGVIEAKTAGRELPADMAYTSDGHLTTDPGEALNGALRTFDKSSKGSGLSFMVQALAGPLVGAQYAGIGDVTNNWGGHLIIALDPDLLRGQDAVREGVSAMVDKIKTKSRLPGVEEILVPGERGNRRVEAAMSASEVWVEDNVYEELRRLSDADDTSSSSAG